MTDPQDSALPPGYTIRGVPPAATSAPTAPSGDASLPPGYSLRSPADHPEAKISAAPPFGSVAWLKSLLYQGANQGLMMLPTVGAVGGSVVGGTGGSIGSPAGTVAGGLAGAGLGGALGKSVEETVRPLIFPESKGYKYGTASDKAGRILGEGARQAAYELGGQALGRLVQGARELIPAAREVHGIPLLPSERTGSKALGFMEHMTERSLPSMGPMQQFRNQQSAAITKQAQDLANSFSAPGLTQEARGQIIQQGLEQGQEAIRQDVSSAYKALDQMTQSRQVMVPGPPQTVASSIIDPATGKPMAMQIPTRVSTLQGGAPVSLDNTRSAARMLLDELKQEEKILTPTAVQDLKTRLTSMANADGTVTFMGAQQARSDLLDLVRRNEDILATKKSRINSILSQAVDRDMMAAAHRADPSGSLGIVTQLRAANAMAKEQHRVFEQQLVKKVIDTGQPESIAALVRSGGLQETRDLTSVLGRTPPQFMGQVRTQVLNDVLEDVIKASHPTQGMNLAMRPNTFRGDAFAEAIHKIGDEQGQALYGGAGWDSIKRLAAVTERVKPNTQDWLSLHNWVYLNAAAHPFSRYAAGVAATGGAMRLMAEAMTRPGMVDRMAQFMAKAARQAPRGIDLAGKEIDSALNKTQYQQVQEPQQ